MHLGELSRKNKGSLLSDLILGGQDGLVGILGIILGFAAATSSTKLVIIGGLAATFAESISMAAVTLTSKTAERDHYLSELAREKKEIKEVPEMEEAEIRQIYKDKGFSGKLLDDIVEHIIAYEHLWVEQMMKDELELKEITKKEIIVSSLIVGSSTLIGSFVPITPYFFAPIKTALWISLAVSVIILFLMGVYKAKLTTRAHLKDGLRMVLVGMTAALAGYFIGHLLSSIK
jgi:VIT1/CCC1 family predicted Fe2+/Mn2+ transporter